MLNLNFLIKDQTILSTIHKVATAPKKFYFNGAARPAIPLTINGRAKLVCPDTGATMALTESVYKRLGL